MRIPTEDEFTKMRKNILKKKNVRVNHRDHKTYKGSIRYIS
jgi:hypothetical protein